MLSLSSLITSLTATGRLGAQVIARVTLPSGLYAVSDAESEITWNGNTYVGMGAAFQAAVPPGTTIGKQQPATLKLTYDIDSISTIQAENYRKAPTNIAVLLKDLSTASWVGEIPVFKGYLDTLEIEMAEARIEEAAGLQLATATFSVLPLSAKLDQVGVRVRSDADQRTHRDALDGFFKDVGVAAKSQINWGRSGPGSPASTLGNGFGAGGGATPLDIANQVARKFFN